MNKIYDLVLNFTEKGNPLQFYEWSKKDSLTYIESIPIIKISSEQLEGMQQNDFKISETELKKIYNQTKTINKIIPYCMLVTDSLRVIAYCFNEEGFAIKESCLLLDEEEDVLIEITNQKKEKISLKKIKCHSNHDFFTRKEKSIQDYLLKEIENIYRKKEYELIHYLYCEITSYPRKIEEEYQYLLNKIKYHYQDSYQQLLDIILLVRNEKKN